MLYKCRDCGGVFSQDESDTEFCPGCQYEKDKKEVKMEKLKIGHDIDHNLLTILITSRTDIVGTTYILCVIPSKQEYVSFRISEDGELCGAVYYSACAFHMAYEEYLSRF